MLIQTTASDLFVDLSTENQQFLAGGKCKKYGRCEKPTEGSSPISSKCKTRMAVGFLVEVTPFSKPLPESDCSGEEMCKTYDS